LLAQLSLVVKVFPPKKERKKPLKENGSNRDQFDLNLHRLNMTFFQQRGDKGETTGHHENKSERTGTEPTLSP
jgi:hypothetical protein